MSRYILVDDNDQIYTINDNTFRRGEDSSSIEVDIIEKTFRSGAVFPGIQRDESKTITFLYNAKPDGGLATKELKEQSYRNKENELRMWLRKTRWLRDTVNNYETEVYLKTAEIAYDEGSMHLVSDNTIELVQLRPFWQDIGWITEEESGATSGTIILNNNGYVETPPIITLTALETCQKFSVRVNETGNGILIEDYSFGTAGQNTYIIDNMEGEAELNGVDRRSKIKANTGFFNLQVGINTLIFDSLGQCTFKVQYKRRYYI